MPDRAGSEGRSALANLIFKAASLPVEKALRLLVVLLSGRALGEAAFGRFQFASTVTTLLALGTDLGLGIWSTRALARDRARAAAVVGTGLALRLLASAPYALVTAVVAWAVGPGETRAAFLFLGVAALAGAFADHFAAVMRGFERLDDEAHLNVGRALFIVAAALAALWRWRSVAALSAGVMVGTVAGALYGLAILRRHYRLPAAPGAGGFDRALARTAAAEALPLWLASLLSLLYFKGDVVFLRLFSGDAELGAYSAAYKLFEGTMNLPAVLLAALFPVLARAHGDRGRQRRLEGLVIAVLGACGLAVGLVLYLGRAPIIRIGYGPTFGRAAASLRVLALAVPLLYCNFGLTHFLIARDLGRRNLAFAATALVTNVALNLLVIPRWGGPGAAAATVLTEVTLTACCLWALGWGPSALLASRRSPAPPSARTARTSG
jgi:O-antigen/teichoic acid export membrane protein